MLWDWSQNDITWDQNCWKFDGSNECNLGAGGVDAEEELISARYKALKLAIYKYYGISDTIL